MNSDVDPIPYSADTPELEHVDHEMEDVDNERDEAKVWQETKCYFCILVHILSNIESILIK